MHLIGIDCETGGLPIEDSTEQPSLLTLYMAVLDNDYNIIHAIDLKLKPDPHKLGRSLYHIQPEAMGVNRIDLINHDLHAITYKEAKPIIYQWLKDMYDLYGKLVPFGNVISHDIDKIAECTISRESLNQFIDRRAIDLTSLGQTLKIMGKIPDKQSLSLSAIARFFDVKVDDLQVHTAYGDVMLGIKVLKCYMDMMEKKL